MHQLIRAILLKTFGEPHLAPDVFNKFPEAHPQRAILSIQVVRNNLEILATKNVVERSHQKKSAMHTAHAATSDAAAAEADSTSETADERVPGPSFDPVGIATENAIITVSPVAARVPRRQTLAAGAFDS